jgi:uncharacterized protein (TIGR00106 family)
MTVHAEISMVPISKNAGTSMSQEVALAFDAIRKTQGIKATLTALGTQVEAESMSTLFASIDAAHLAVKRSGAARIITSVRIDERLDKEQTLEGKVRSVEKRLA